MTVSLNITLARCMAIGKGYVRHLRRLQRTQRARPAFNLITDASVTADPDAAHSCATKSTLTDGVRMVTTLRLHPVLKR